MHRPRSLLALPLLALAATAVAQQWTPLGIAPRYRSAHGIATDPTTGRPLLFGGNAAYNWMAVPFDDADTWRWNGTTWYRCPTTSAPAAQDAMLMATDTVRRRVVLVANAAASVATWEWDGGGWLQVTTNGAPPAGTALSAALAFDGIRARTVLFDAAAQQTCEYDGSNWTTVPTAHVPGPRFGFRLAHDLLRGRTVLFGGDDGSRRHTCFQDTFEYDGLDWTQVTPLQSPPARNEFAFAFDLARQGVLLYGGRVSQALLNDTWLYDGVTWTQQNPATPPPPQVEPAMAADRTDGGIVLATGEDVIGGAGPVTFTWDGTDWHRAAVPVVPSVREMHAVAVDATGQLLLFGGYNAAFSGLGGPVFGDTWHFDGRQWTQLSPQQAPSGRAFVQLANDTARGRVVLFGGEGNNVWSPETWEWDGATWTLRSSSGPVARSRGAMAFDAPRGRCVLHGGTDGNQTFGDTWLWDGTQWTQALGNGPAARTDAAMAAGNGLLFLFGGALPGPVATNDLWQWNGMQWTQLAATTPPAPRAFHDFTWDPVRQRFLLHGGDSVADSWEWNGASTWTALAGAGEVGTVTATGAAYDLNRQSVLLFDGSQLWTATTQPAHADGYGQGCGTPAPALVAGGRPFLGSPAFGFEVVGAGVNGLSFLCASFAAASTPLPGGCTVLVQNPVTLGFAFAGAAGVATFAVPVPANPALKGTTLYTQAAVLAPSQALALSQGVRCAVGD